MTTTTTAGAPAPTASANALTANQLPTWATPVGAGVAALVGLGLAFAATGGFNPGLAVALALVVFLATLHVASLVIEGARKATDRFFKHLVYVAFGLALLPLISLLWTVLAQGLRRFDVTFFTWSMRNVVGEGGGATHAITGTLFVTGIAAFFVDVMTGIPSIVAGLFAYAVFALLFGPGFSSGLAGAVALSVLMIPVVVRSTEELLRIVPNELREASYALGVPKWKTILQIVLPTAVSGIVAGVMLALARVIGETAPLMIAAGFTQSLNTNPLVNPMMTLPVFVYDQYARPGIPNEPYWDRAWAGALTLILIVMVLNFAGRLTARRFAPKTGR